MLLRLKAVLNMMKVGSGRTTQSILIESTLPCHRLKLQRDTGKEFLHNLELFSVIVGISINRERKQSFTLVLVSRRMRKNWLHAAVSI